MFDFNDLGEFLVLFFKNVSDYDIEVLLSFCFTGKIFTKETNNFKEYLILTLCIANYNCYREMLATESKELAKLIYNTKLDLIISHLIAIKQCYFNNYLFFPSNTDKINVDEGLFKKQNSLQKVISKLFSHNNISETDIPIILSIIIDNYRKYKFYYCFAGDELCKIEIKKQKFNNVIDSFEETYYEIIEHERFTILKNKKTGNTTQINISNKITPFFIDKKQNYRIKLPTLKEFIKINSEITRALDEDSKAIKCAWCNPNRDNTTTRKMCSNCKNLLDELKHCQDLGYIDKNINFNKEITSIKYGKINTKETLLKNRKSVIKDIVNNLNCKDIEDVKNRLTELINMSFGNDS